MQAASILTVSAVVVALTQLVRWAGVPDRWGPVVVVVLAGLGVWLWAGAGGNGAPPGPFDYVAAWVSVATSAAGVFGFTRATARYRRRKASP
jgi:hypothetical protein